MVRPLELAKELPLSLPPEKLHRVCSVQADLLSSGGVSLKTTPLLVAPRPADEAIAAADPETGNHPRFLKAASAPAAKSWPSPPGRPLHLALRPCRKVAWFCYAPLADFYSAIDNLAFAVDCAPHVHLPSSD